MNQALDYSTARPDPAAIVAAGFSGVLRYLAPPFDAAKVIYAPEYAALRAAGLEVALNWEWYGTRAREGAVSGAQDARDALAQADALGYPGLRPIYFSVDYNAPPGDQFMINAYFAAAASVIGLGRLGGYGGYWVVKRLFDAGLISYGWQASAWSGGLREPRAHLYQNGGTALGGDVDDILRADWAGPRATTGGSMGIISHPVLASRLDIFFVSDTGQVEHRWTIDGGLSGLLGDSSSTGNESWGNPGFPFAPLSVSAAWDPSGNYINVLAAGQDGSQWGQVRPFSAGITTPSTWQQVSPAQMRPMALPAAGGAVQTVTLSAPGLTVG